MPVPVLFISISPVVWQTPQHYKVSALFVGGVVPRFKTRHTATAIFAALCYGSTGTARYRPQRTPPINVRLAGCSWRAACETPGLSTLTHMQHHTPHTWVWMEPIINRIPGCGEYRLCKRTGSNNISTILSEARPPAPWTLKNRRNAAT